MSGKDLAHKLNGKKRYVVGGIGTIVGMRFLVPFFISMHTTVVATETIVKSHTERIEKVEKKAEETPKQVAAIETEVKGLKENVKGLKGEFVDFRNEQRKDNGKKAKKLEKIYDAIMAK